MHFISTLLTSFATLINFNASNLYTDGYAGANFVTNEKVDNVVYCTGVGAAFGGSVGYEINQHVKIEEEVCWRVNPISSLDVSHYSFEGSGFTRCGALMTNVILSIPDGDDPFVPYIGGGMGKHWTKNSFKLDDIEAEGQVLRFPKRITKLDNLAAQAFLGCQFLAAEDYSSKAEFRVMGGNGARLHTSLIFHFLKRF